MRRYLSLLLVPGVLAAAISLLYAASVHRSLAHEGGYIYWWVLNHGIPCWDQGLWRVFDVVIQFPALVAIHIWPHNAIIPITLLDYSYALPSIISIIVTIWFLVKHERPDLIVFPIFSFATATLSTTAYGIGQALYGLAIFWPLFVLILFPGRRTRVEWAAIGLLSLGLAFSHESTGLCFIFLAAFAAWRKEKKVFFLMLAGCFWYLFRYLDLYFELHHPGNSGLPSAPFHDLIRAMLFNVESYRWITFAAVAAFAMAAIAGVYRRTRIFSIICGVLAIVISGAGLAWLVRHGTLYDYRNLSWARDARTSATPVAMISAGLMAVLESPLKKQKWVDTAVYPILIAAVASALCLSIYRDFTATHEWTQGWEYFKGLMSQAPCVDVDDTESGGPVSYRGSITEYGLLMMEETLRPRSLVLFDRPCEVDGKAQPIRTSCDRFDGGQFPVNCGQGIPNDRMNFVNVVSGMLVHPPLHVR